MLNAISSIKNFNSVQLDDKKIQLLNTKRYHNVKTFLDDIINNQNPKIPEEMSEIENIVRFKIEEFNFNPMPGPFISDLSITKELLDDQLENISFNQS